MTVTMVERVTFTEEEKDDFFDAKRIFNKIFDEAPCGSTIEADADTVLLAICEFVDKYVGME